MTLDENDTPQYSNQAVTIEKVSNARIQKNYRISFGEFPLKKMIEFSVDMSSSKVIFARRWDLVFSNNGWNSMNPTSFSDCSLH